MIEGSLGYTKDCGYYPLSEIAEQYDAPLELVTQMNDEEAQKVYDEFCTDRKGSVEERNWIHNMMPVGYSHGIALKNIRKRLEQLGYEDKLQKKIKNRKKAFEGIIDSKVVCTEPTSCTRFAFDIATLGLMHGSIKGSDVEPALAAYAKNQTDLAEYKKTLPLKHRSKGVNLTMHESFFDLVDKLANGQRCKATIIEVAIWQYYGEKHE